MGYQQILNFSDVASLGIFVFTSVVTIIALAISTRYVLKKIFSKNSGAETKQVPMKGKTAPSPPDVTVDDNSDEEEVDLDKDGSGKSGDSPPVLSPRYPDPVDYCEHIQGEIKRVQQKVATKSIAKTLTEDQLKEEREIQREQLATIFRLMQEQQDRFGIGTMDDMQEQMKLYAM
ncbi:hypothetical protein EGW08_009695 [Elysia chlorotica]|uniref:Matrix-remodeling-associated protein 7 helical domain-containing protein n=1 Tax=Elysia chlorotica TaxID=188477 RepID=A0A433TLY6_ELYCH|nr:hypothetical protein EGW08_009695 [Elysia chlorotica]